MLFEDLIRQDGIVKAEIIQLVPFLVQNGYGLHKAHVKITPLLFDDTIVCLCGRDRDGRRYQDPKICYLVADCLGQINVLPFPFSLFDDAGTNDGKIRALRKLVPS